jgi:hypothetical protein
LTGYGALSINFHNELKMNLVESSFSCIYGNCEFGNNRMSEIETSHARETPAYSERLLAHDEPAPAAMERAGGTSPMLLIADHAGNLVPRSLRQLGLPQSELDRHIGVDIGILGVCQELSELLDATFIYQRYSRLVIDCNRHPQCESAFVAVSDQTRIPGNSALTVADAARRITEIFYSIPRCHCR